MEGFRAAHRQEYGYDIEGRPVEVVNLRLSVKGTSTVRAESRHEVEPGDPLVGRRQVYFDGDWLETPIYRRARLAIDTPVAGPAIIEEMSSTTIVEPGCTARIDVTGTMILEVSK